MNNNFENPFKQSYEAPANLTALAEQGFLSPEDIAKLKELEGQKDPSSKFQVPGSMEGISLEEGMSAEERKNLELMETRKRIIEWAEKHDLGDEDWVDNLFEFNDDGTVICNSDLDLNALKEPYIPECIIRVDGTLFLSGLTTAVGLKLPRAIAESLILNNLESAKGLVIPLIGGDLNLSGLTSAKDLHIPNTASGSSVPAILGSIYLDGLTSAEGLKLPDVIKGVLSLEKLESVEGLVLPEVIEGGVNLDSITTAEGLEFPDSFSGGIILSNLTSAEGLELPNHITDELDLGSLVSAKGLKLPESVDIDLYLNSLTSAEGLTLPNTIGGGLYLFSLTSAEGLILTDIKGDVYLDKLPASEIQQLRENYPNLKIE